MNQRDTAADRRRPAPGIVPVIVLTALGFCAAGVVACGATESLELLGSVTTPTSLSLARWGDPTLVGSASGLVVEDLRDPLAASILHTLELGFRVEAIEVVGDTAVARGPGGASALIRLDGPAGPELIESPTSHALPNAWIGGLPYRVVQEDGELRVLALAGGGAVLVGALPVGALPVDGAPVALAVDGTTVYLLTFATPPPLAESYTPVVAVSVADPAHPVAVGRWEPPVSGAQHETYGHLAARDGWVYQVGRLEPVAGVVRFLRPIDFRAPAAPAGQRVVNTGQVITPRDLALDGGRAVVVGEPLTGVEVGLTDCQAVGAPVLVSTLTVGADLNSNLDNVELRVDPYPSAGMVECVDCDGVGYGVAGGSAFVTRVTPVESVSWGAIRALYRR